MRGIRDAQRHAGITPTNHSRHNIQAVKEQSRINALQKAQQKDDRIIAAHTAARSKGTATGGRQAAGYTAAAAAGRQQPSRSSSLGSSGGGADISAARDFVEENKLAAAAAAARRHIKAESKAAAGAGEFLHKSEYGQVRGGDAVAAAACFLVDVGAVLTFRCALSSLCLIPAGCYVLLLGPGCWGCALACSRLC